MPTCVDTSGNVGIGTTSPGVKLDVAGVVRSSGTMYVGGAPYTSFFYYACFDGALGFTYGNSCSGSDIKLKKNIEPLSDGLARALKMRGVTFEWTDEKRGMGRQIGFIAQEMEKTVPEVVTAGPDGTKGIDYQKLTAVLAEGIKELKSIFDSDHAELMKLKAANENQAAALKALEAKFEAYKAARR